MVLSVHLMVRWRTTLQPLVKEAVDSEEVLAAEVEAVDAVVEAAAEAEVVDVAAKMAIRSGFL